MENTRATTKALIFSLATATLLFSSSSQSGNDNFSKKIAPPHSQKVSIVHFEQGWSDNETLDFYYTSQGSQLIPYAWFLALEQADGETLFRDGQHLEKFGYIPQEPLAGRNPDGLPIGFTKDSFPAGSWPASSNYEHLGKQTNTQQKNYNEWLGLTCSACHTAELHYGEYRLRINGGPSLSDLPMFLNSLQKAIDATVADKTKLARFSKQVLGEDSVNAAAKDALTAQLIAFSQWLASYISMNYGALHSPYGYGRIDAFGAILNRVTASLLDIPENQSPANAPVSYPFLWNSSQLDWVQWNGSASIHIGRNIGEATGVFAHTILKTDNDKERFYSSANIMILDQLKKIVARLESPQWGPPLPPIDQKKAAAGAKLYADNCVNCHGIRDENGQFPMTPINAVGKRFIRIHMIDLEKIGTDPLMARNIVDPNLDVNPGQLRPYLDADLQSAPKVARVILFSTLVKKIIEKQLAEFNPPLSPSQLLELTGYHLPNETPPNVLAYKARPLNGIWATAPYLHNGSVANMYQLLLPESERELEFYLSNAAFDPKNLGFEPRQSGNYFLFKTRDEKGAPIAGNSNKGHSGNNFTKTRAANGQWRDFTDTERYQLIEYLKSL